jgi:hypothetical protein
MSTEAKITPYDGGGNRDQGSGIAGDIAVGAIGLAAGAAIALIAKSLTLDEKQEDALARRKEEERKGRARLIKPEKPKLIAVPLKLKDPDTLVQSAIHLGFKLKPLELTKACIHHQPSITLTRPSGETMIIQKTETGRLSIMTHENNLPIIPEVVKRHTVDQVIDHLKRQCTSVEVKKGSGGDYVIVAREGNWGQKDGPAKITTHISKDGTAMVDVSNIKGRRCEEIINGITRAIGGECVKSRKKNEYFQLPVEEKEKVRV